MQKEKHKSIIDGFFYACCLYCKTTLTQAKNGTEALIKCPLCGEYIHIVIKNDTVLTRRKAT
ncbi:MAG: hypothetical protein K2J83_00630 [Clostridia bacterium]|nr:hypothetical protein [Clostridia bacterium]